MIKQNDIQTYIAEALKAYLGCEVVLANQTAPIPSYPYVSFTITTPMVANNGTYGEFVEDNTLVKAKEIQQIWSFTVQSDDSVESATVANKAYDFFDCVGTIQLNENGVVVQRIENITNRDNLLTIEYEYRNGFDVTFSFMNEITQEIEEIDRITFNGEPVD